MSMDFADLAQACTTSEAFEAGALELLGRRVGFDAAFFMVKDCERAPTILGLDAATAERAALQGAAYADELLPVKRAALAARGVAVDTDVCGVSHVRKTRYFREIASNVAGDHTLVAFVPWAGRIMASVMLGRAGRGFSSAEVGFMERLLPTLGVARAAFGVPWVAGPLSSPPRTLLERLGSGGASRVLASVRTPSGELTVRDRVGFREMVARNAGSELVWSRVSLTDSRRSGWPYTDLLHLAPALAKSRRRALFIGSGGAVSVRQFAAVYPGMAIDVVERERAVIELAREWFDFAAIPGVTVHIAEGAAFVANAEKSSWDVVVVDAYDASSFAAEFSRRGFLLALREALRPGGAVACNIIGTLAERGEVAEFVRSARGVFDSVRVVPVVALDERYAVDALRNVVVVAVRAD